MRTIYRDIQALIAQGAPIEGEAGIGYVLRPGFTLPPLMFSHDEIEAIVLGSGLVARAADPALAKAARNAVAKITAVLPAGRSHEAEASGLLAGAITSAPVDGVNLAPIRSAIRTEQKIWIAYNDETACGPSDGYGRSRSPSARACVCSPHGANFARTTGTFRTDRIAGFAELGERYPRRRRALIKEWRAIEGLPEPG